MILENKIAIVTGARRGIGKAIAIALAKEGCNVVISDIDQKDCEQVAQEIQSLGVKAMAIQCDVSKRSDVEKLFQETIKAFGHLDILVNNAGIFPFIPFKDMQESDWDKVININLKSVFLCSQEAIKVMPEGSRIINMSSIAAYVGVEGQAHYCASKGGISSMIRTLALELAHSKITVNAIAPGPIDTPGVNQVATEELKKQAISMIPLGRFGQPEDIANVAVFLASDKSSFITGQTIIADGGWTLR